MFLHDKAGDIRTNSLNHLARNQRRRSGETNRAQLQHASDQIMIIISEASVQGTLQRSAARLDSSVLNLGNDGGELTAYAHPLSSLAACRTVRSRRHA